MQALLTAVPLENGFGPKGALTVLQALCRDGYTEVSRHAIQINIPVHFVIFPLSIFENTFGVFVSHLTQVVRALLSGGLHWATDEEALEAMTLAAFQGHLGVVLALQEAGFVLDDEKRVEVLHEAICSNDLSMFDALLSKRGPSSIELNDWVGETTHPHEKTLLHVACREASTKLVASMVEHYGWDKDKTDGKDQSPLVYAVRGHCFNTMTLAYLTKVVCASTEGLSEKHMSALMKRVSTAMATPVGGAILQTYRHPYTGPSRQIEVEDMRTHTDVLPGLSCSIGVEGVSALAARVPRGKRSCNVHREESRNRAGS
jgi:hypothetical protein